MTTKTSTTSSRIADLEAQLEALRLEEATITNQEITAAQAVLAKYGIHTPSKPVVLATTPKTKEAPAASPVKEETGLDLVFAACQRVKARTGKPFTKAQVLSELHRPVGKGMKRASLKKNTVMQYMTVQLPDSKRIKRVRHGVFDVKVS
jgi:hypothetical protein